MIFLSYIAGPALGFGNSSANKTTPTRPRHSEPQNPGFTLPNFKNSPTIPGFGSIGEITSTVQNANSALRPEAPPFKPGRPDAFEPPAPQRLLQPNKIKQEPGQRAFDGPRGDHNQFGHGRPGGDFEGRRPGRESWDDPPRGPPGDFKPPNWRDQGANNFGHGRDFRPDDGGPNFRGPPRDRFNGPQGGILGSPPRNPEVDPRPGLLGAPPTQDNQQLMSGPGGPQAGSNSQAGNAGMGNDFPRQGMLALFLSKNRNKNLRDFSFVGAVHSPYKIPHNWTTKQ